MAALVKQPRRKQLCIMVTEEPLEILRGMLRENGQSLSWAIDRFIHQEVIARGGRLASTVPKEERRGRD